MSLWRRVWRRAKEAHRRQSFRQDTEQGPQVDQDQFNK